MDSIYIAKNLHFLRVFNKLTQVEIENSTGFKQRNWSNWENDVSQPSLTNLITISNNFGVPTDWILKLDLEQNVHLIKNLPLKIEEVKCTTKSTSYCTSNEVNEPEPDYGKVLELDTNKQILDQLKTLTDEVKKIGQNLQPKAI